MEKIKSILQTVCSAVILILGIVGILWLLTGVAIGDEIKNNSPATESARIGDLTVNFVRPDGLVRVNGLCPEADAFIDSLRDRFKLNVLAVYADADQWRVFADGLAKGQPRMVPSMAIVSSTTRMEGKSYDLKGVARERRHLNNMVSLAVNTKPLSMIMSNRANAKLRDKLGQDLGFSYSVGNGIGRFAETDRSISFALMTSLNLYGLRTDSFLTATALNVGDKFIYLTWFNPDRSPEGIDLLKIRSTAWTMSIAEINSRAG